MKEELSTSFYLTNITLILVLSLFTKIAFCNNAISLDEIGVPKNVKDLFSVFEKNAGALTSAQQHELIAKMYLSESPVIDLDSLLKIWESKRKSLSNFTIGYQEATWILGQNGKEENRRDVDYKYTYAGKNKLQITRNGKRSDKDADKGIVSLNGDIAVTVTIPEDNLINASLSKVDPLEYMVSFWNPFNPMLCSSLLSDEDFYQQPNVYRRDIVRALSDPTAYHILPGIEDVNGYRCVVVANISSRFCLSIDNNFAIVQYTTYQPVSLPEDANKNPDERRFIGRKQTFQCNMTDMIDIGNGIWFPKKIEIESNRESLFARIDVNEVKINHKIPDSVFTNVIPDGAYVADGIRNMVYRWGDRPSIGSLIKETVKSKRQTIFRNLSVVCGLCFLACWGFIEWRKKRLLKENTE